MIDYTNMTQQYKKEGNTINTTTQHFIILIQTKNTPIKDIPAIYKEYKYTDKKLQKFIKWVEKNEHILESKRL